jgi:hypothetical protein
MGAQMKKENELENWSWPYLRYSDGPEYACPHGVGHGIGVHGCDGCPCNKLWPCQKCKKQVLLIEKLNCWICPRCRSVLKEKNK